MWNSRNITWKNEKLIRNNQKISNNNQTTTNNALKNLSTRKLTLQWQYPLPSDCRKLYRHTDPTKNKSQNHQNQSFLQNTRWNDEKFLHWRHAQKVRSTKLFVDDSISHEQVPLRNCNLPLSSDQEKHSTIDEFRSLPFGMRERRK